MAFLADVRMLALVESYETGAGAHISKVAHSLLTYCYFCKSRHVTGRAALAHTPASKKEKIIVRTFLHAVTWCFLQSMHKNYLHHDMYLIELYMSFLDANKQTSS